MCSTETRIAYVGSAGEGKIGHEEKFMLLFLCGVEGFFTKRYAQIFMCN